jgi:hypothetical protein
VTAEWLHKWGLLKGNENPHRNRISATLEYLRRFAIDSAYTAEKGQTESIAAYKRRVDDTLHHISRMQTESRQMSRHLVATNKLPHPVEELRGNASSQRNKSSMVYGNK